MNRLFIGTETSCVFFQNGVTYMSQEYTTNQITETQNKKRRLISQAQELESQVKQLQSSVEIGEQLVNQLPQGYYSRPEMKRRLYHLEMENQNPSDRQTTEGSETKQRGRKNEKKRGRPKLQAHSNGLKKVNEVSKKTENNLSIRKLLENTHTDPTVKSAGLGVTNKALLNCRVENGRLKNVVPMTRPSLPISIPLDCLPENNVRQAMEHAVKTSQDSSVRGVHISVNKPNNAPLVKASIDQSLLSSDKSSSSSILVTNRASPPVGKVNMVIDKIALPKKYEHLFNGSVNNEMIKHSIIDKLENQKSGKNVSTSEQKGISALKRKYPQEMDSASKRLLVSGNDLNAALFTKTAVGLGQTVSPESHTSTAMLISTANQPLAITAIPSPDLHGKQLQHRTDGM